MAKVDVGQTAILSDEERERFEGYEFPFENLVLEGGGAKLVGGVGTVRVLEELGVLGKMKRFGGSSAGSLLATLIALGYNGSEIEQLMYVDLNEKIEDECSLFTSMIRLINLVKRYGLHKGSTLKKWLGEVVARKMDGNPDATFWELYKKTGKELVCTSTELMQKECVYYHVKTTPDYPIRDAVFKSMSFPVAFRPTVDTDAIKDEQVFVDGGVIYNYPIHCFDGWFLSPGEDNDFIKKHIELGEKDEDFWKEQGRFTGRNDKTIGLIVYSIGEVESLRAELETRNQGYIKQHNIPTMKPESKLKRQSQKENPGESSSYQRQKEAQLRFAQKIAEQVGISTGDAMDVADQKDNHFTDEDAALLFGPGVDAETAIKRHMAKMDAMDDTDEEGGKSLPFDRDMVVKSSTGLELMRQKQINNSQSATPRRINNVGEYLGSVLNFYGDQMMRLNQRPTDYPRTIGVNVDYITTGDYTMEDADREFLLQQSKTACLAFLQERITENEDLTKKTK